VTVKLKQITLESQHHAVTHMQTDKNVSCNSWTLLSNNCQQSTSFAARNPYKWLHNNIL